MKRGTVSEANGVWVAVDERYLAGEVKQVAVDGKALPLSTQARTALHSLGVYLGQDAAQQVQLFFQPNGTGHTVGISRVKAEQGSEALRKLNAVLPVVGQEYDEAQSRELLGAMHGIVQRTEQRAGWAR